MAEDTMEVFEVLSKQKFEIASLKETLCTQQKLLQNLYNELEVEREASSTAASEALSMILRLQGEKAAVKMEAEQYKRLVEAKMCQAEESLSISEDLIYHKEMEIAALDYQIQAYRYKLLSMGCVDPGIAEIKFPGNFLPRRNSAPPPFPLKDAFETKGVVAKEGSTSPDRDLNSKNLEENAGKKVMDDHIHQGSDSGKRTDNSSGVGNVGISSYWEQISRLDERVKEIVGANYANSRSETSCSSSLLSQFSNGNSSENTVAATMSNEIEKVEHPGKFYENEINATDPTCSPGVLDVFEVPQVDHWHQTRCLLEPKDEGKMVLSSDNAHKRPDSVPREGLKSEARGETDLKLKKLLNFSPEKKLQRAIGNVENGCCKAFVCQTTSIAESQSIINQLNRPSEIVEAEANSTRDEELKLLKEIKVKLNAIESEISSLKTKRSPPKDEQALVSYMEVSLREAMLHFWL